MSRSSPTYGSSTQLSSTQGSSRRGEVALTTATEPMYVSVIKGLLYAVALALYLHPFCSRTGLVAAAVAGWAGMALASIAFRRRLRIAVALVAGPVCVLAALVVGDRLLYTRLVADALGIVGTLVLNDVVVFALAGGCTVFLLRVLALRVRALSLLEVAFVAGAVTTFFADHRNRMINRPRFFSDWAWTHGFDPTGALVAVGVATMLLAVLFFLRRQPVLKLLSSLALLMLLGGLFYSLGGKRLGATDPTDALGLTGKSKPDHGGSRSGGNGQNGKGGGADSPFRNDFTPPTPPQPVAIAILRDDYDARDGLMYFRQRALSRYNGVSLTADDPFDADVITQLPRSGSAQAAPSPRGGAAAPTSENGRAARRSSDVGVQEPEAHTKLPTTMYLLVDHPQPPALSHARRIWLAENPNPRQFVAAYEVESQVLSVPSARLIGHHTIPPSWSREQIAHYTALPDDPRYRTLAEIIVRQLDPRFADDDVARAFAIKQYLEHEGFYTRRTTHASAQDPTASFLFGDVRGYCVHFAHAAVYLMRSLGIASRVVLGYAVQTNKRSGGSSILIMSDRAHAWPEIFVAGIGWVTFDIYPQRTDLPPPSQVDYDLEKLLGELARKDPTGGLSPDGKPLVLPWRAIAKTAGALALALVLIAFAIKAARRLAPPLRRGDAYCRLAYLAVLDRLTEVGRGRQRGESRERHAARVATLAPHMVALTEAHLGRALGSRTAVEPEPFRALVAHVRRELRQQVSPWRRWAGLANPMSWLWTR